MVGRFLPVARQNLGIAAALRDLSLISGDGCHVMRRRARPPFTLGLTRVYCVAYHDIVQYPGSRLATYHVHDGMCGSLREERMLCNTQSHADSNARSHANSNTRSCGRS